MFYATATKAVNHGAPCAENGVVGVAVKQKAVSAAAGIGGSPDPQKQIGIGEQFAIISKGIVQVPIVGSPAKGTPVFLTAASNALTLTGPAAPPTTLKFGLVVELPTDNPRRGVPTGYMRVDLDKKDAI
jgi:hypothetical protein